MADDINSMVDVEYEEIKSKRFEHIGMKWKITEYAKAHFV